MLKYIFILITILLSSFVTASSQESRSTSQNMRVFSYQIYYNDKLEFSSKDGGIVHFDFVNQTIEVLIDGEPLIEKNYVVDVKTFENGASAFLCQNRIGMRSTFIVSPGTISYTTGTNSNIRVDMRANITMDK